MSLVCMHGCLNRRKVGGLIIVCVVYAWTKLHMHYTPI